MDERSVSVDAFKKFFLDRSTVETRFELMAMMLAADTGFHILFRSAGKGDEQAQEVLANMGKHGHDPEAMQAKCKLVADMIVEYEMEMARQVEEAVQ